MSESRTPRTDREVEDLSRMAREGETYTESVSSIFTRQLEHRELREAITKAHSLINYHSSYGAAMEVMANALAATTK